MSRFLRSIPLLLCAWLLTTTAARAQTELRWRFKSGDELRYELAQQMKFDSANAGRNLSTKVDVTMNSVWRVKSVDEQGVAAIEATFERIRFKLEGQLHVTDYDSQAEEKPDDVSSRPMVQVLDEMIDQPFALQVSPRGEITQFSLPGKLAAKLKAMPAAGNLSLFTAEGLKTLFADSLIVFPATLKEGQTWTRTVETEAPQFGKEKSTHEYTYLGREDHDGRKLDKLAVKTSMAFEVPEGGPVQVAVNNQKSSGTVWFDATAGRVIDGSTQQSADIELTLGGNKIVQKLSAKGSIKQQTK